MLSALPIVPLCQRQQLGTSVEKERSAGNHQSSGANFHEGDKGRIQFILGAGFDETNLPPDGARRCLHFLPLTVGI